MTSVACVSTVLTPSTGDGNLPDMSTARARVPYHEAARQLLRASALDATRELLTEKSWNDITMAHIAEAAGMSRQTLYKEFTSRQGLASGYLIRFVDEFLEEVEREVTLHHSDPRGAVSAAFRAFFDAGARDPMVVSIVGPRPQHDLLSLVTTDGTPLLEHASARLAEIFMTSWANVDRIHAEMFGSTIVRLAISHVTLSFGAPDQIAENLGEMFGPFLDQVIGSGTVEPN